MDRRNAMKTIAASSMSPLLYSPAIVKSPGLDIIERDVWRLSDREWTKIRWSDIKSESIIYIHDTTKEAMIVTHVVPNHKLGMIHTVPLKFIPYANQLPSECKA